MSGEPDGPPTFVGIGIADVGTGVQVLQEYLQYSDTEIARLQQSGTLYREDR
jgi:hypothetical protein